MATERVGLITNYNKQHLQGLSTDTKPTTGVDPDSTYYELDTKQSWVFSVVNINPLTSNGWWEL